uniref:cyclic nucleotide-binding domain-containing protein n=1 Tax=Crenothrix polyspora TaxID=360316 RepID=UPI0015C5E588
MKHIDLLEYQGATVDKSRLFLLKEPETSAPKTKISFLSGVDDEALTILMEKAKTVIYPKHMFIVSEGDVANAFFIILSGKVRVFSGDDKSKEVTFNIWGAGSYFGEIALLTSKPRSVSIVTLEKTVCAVISKNDFIN